MLAKLHGVEEATRSQFGDTHSAPAAPALSLLDWFRRPRAATPCPEARPNTLGVK